MKRFLPVIFLTVSILVLLSSGKLFSDEMFSFHDQTQAARISDFTFAVQNGQIPPRMAHHFSEEMGYPIFNFYAPTAYWIASDLHLLGLSIPDAIKASFVLAVLVLGISTFLLLRNYFSEGAAFVGAFLLASSPFIALEIFVRGNLAELWFLALFPLVLHLIRSLSITKGKVVFVCLTLGFSMFLTAHNALSIVGAGLVILFTYSHENRKLIYSALLLGLIMASYFLVPAFGELGLTHARGIATSTHYWEHFVCLRQLWGSQWGFGGSVPGCVDGMSFMIGKVMILAGLGGGLYWLTRVSKEKLASQKVTIFFAALGLTGVFLSLSYSSFVWIILEAFLELFQFPWRFLGLALFGFAYFSAYVIDALPSKNAKLIFGVLCVLISLFMNMKYFTPNQQKIWSEKDFEKAFLSHEYLSTEVAARVPEYFPKTVDYTTVLTEDKPVMDAIISPLDGGSVDETEHTIFSYDVRTTSKSFYVNKHYMPQWIITIDKKPYVPTEFDSFGRPKIVINNTQAISHITLSYIDTPLEKIANMLSFSSIIVLAMCVHPKLWKKLSH
jgi:hypothetical protein